MKKLPYAASVLTVFLLSFTYAADFTFTYVDQYETEDPIDGRTAIDNGDGTFTVNVNDIVAVDTNGIPTSVTATINGRVNVKNAVPVSGVLEFVTSGYAYDPDGENVTGTGMLTISTAVTGPLTWAQARDHNFGGIGTTTGKAEIVGSATNIIDLVDPVNVDYTGYYLGGTDIWTFEGNYDAVSGGYFDANGESSDVGGMFIIKGDLKGAADGSGSGSILDVAALNITGRADLSKGTIRSNLINVGGNFTISQTGTLELIGSKAAVRSGGTITSRGSIAGSGVLQGYEIISNGGGSWVDTVDREHFPNPILTPPQYKYQGGGLISPGSDTGYGTISIDGNFKNIGGVIQVNLDDTSIHQVDLYNEQSGQIEKVKTFTQQDRIQVSGSAEINSGYVNVLTDKKTVLSLGVNGPRYIFLETDKIGDLSVVNEPLLVFINGENAINTMQVYALQALHDDKSYWLQTSRSTFYSGLAQTFNQRTVAEYLDKVTLNLQYNEKFYNSIDKLDHLTDKEKRRALDELSGAIYSTIGNTGVQNTGVVNSTLADTLRSDVFKFSMIGNPNNAFRGQAIAPLRYSRWATGYGIGGSSQFDGNASGYKMNGGGGIAGVDRAFWTGTRLGVFVSGADSTVSLKQLNEQSRSRDFLVGLYARQDLYYGYILGNFAFGQNMYKTTRHITMLDEIFTNRSHADVGTFYVERGIDVPWNYGVIQPYGNFQIVSIRHKDFNEISNDGLNLKLVHGKTDSFKMSIGSRFSTKPLVFDWGQIAFSANAAWQHDFATENDRDFVAQLDGHGAVTSPISFRVRGNDPMQDWFNFGYGVHWDRNSTRVFVGGALYANERQTFYAGNGGFVTSW